MGSIGQIGSENIEGKDVRNQFEPYELNWKIRGKY